MENNYSPEPKLKRIGPKFGRIIGWAGIGLMFAFLFALFFGFFVKWLWNMLMPGIFGLPTISFWQAFALIILAKLLFGGFSHPHHSPHRSWGNHCNWHHHPSNSSDGSRHGFKDNSTDWREYRQFWKDEGKEAFQAYINKKKNSRQG
ncbi:MAG: hypothetical protein PVI90_18640 [Desulfobacteraceae bacterium]|jgi:hypothetical protein